MFKLLYFKKRVIMFSKLFENKKAYNSFVEKAYETIHSKIPRGIFCG